MKNAGIIALHTQASLLPAENSTSWRIFFCVNLTAPDLIHDAVCIRSMSGVIEYWSGGAEKLYGWSTNEAVGLVSHALFKTIFPAPLDQIEAELLRTGSWEGELAQMLKDGTLVTVESRWSLLCDESSVPVAILEINGNITERTKANAEWPRLEQRRQGAKVEAIGRFVNDFNNVLGGIVAFGEMLFEDAPDNTPQKRHAENVLAAATRGSELVRQILD